MLPKALSQIQLLFGTPCIYTNDSAVNIAIVNDHSAKISEIFGQRCLKVRTLLVYNYETV
jgi:hypothetical protein